jgi:hypothetical protein
MLVAASPKISSYVSNKRRPFGRLFFDHESSAALMGEPTGYPPPPGLALEIGAGCHSVNPGNELEIGAYPDIVTFDWLTRQLLLWQQQTYRRTYSLCHNWTINL